MSSSLLEVITGGEELIQCSKLTCFAKRMLNIVAGQSDRRSVSATVGHRRQTSNVESDLEKGKSRSNTTYPNSQEEKTAILDT